MTLSDWIKGYRAACKRRRVGPGRSSSSYLYIDDRNQVGICLGAYSNGSSAVHSPVLKHSADCFDSIVSDSVILPRRWLYRFSHAHSLTHTHTVTQICCFYFFIEYAALQWIIGRKRRNENTLPVTNSRLINDISIERVFVCDVIFLVFSWKMYFLIAGLPSR